MTLLEKYRGRTELTTISTLNVGDKFLIEHRGKICLMQMMCDAQTRRNNWHHIEYMNPNTSKCWSTYDYGWAVNKIIK